MILAEIGTVVAMNVQDVVKKRKRKNAIHITMAIGTTVGTMAGVGITAGGMAVKKLAKKK